MQDLKTQAKPLKKQPKQARSQQIVESILVGATRILSRTKLQDVSTNHIAEEAGVGIGSVYDYFPNKKSIVVSLIDQRIDECLRNFQTLLEKNPDKSVEALIEDLLVLLKSEYLDRKDFLREIFSLAPESGRMASLLTQRQKAIDYLTGVLTERGFEPDPELARKKAFLAVNSTMGLIEAYVMLEPGVLSADEMIPNLRRVIRSALS